MSKVIAYHTSPECVTCEHFDLAGLDHTRESYNALRKFIANSIKKIGSDYLFDSDIELIEQVDRFELAVQEALQNASRHGKGKVRVCIGYIVSTDIMCAAISDEGEGIQKAVRVEMPSIEELGGRGIPIMESCADTVRFLYEIGEFTVLLRKRVQYVPESSSNYGVRRDRKGF